MLVPVVCDRLIERGQTTRALAASQASQACNNSISGTPAVGPSAGATSISLRGGSELESVDPSPRELRPLYDFPLSGTPAVGSSAGATSISLRGGSELESVDPSPRELRPLYDFPLSGTPAVGPSAGATSISLRGGSELESVGPSPREPRAVTVTTTCWMSSMIFTSPTNGARTEKHITGCTLGCIRARCSTLSIEPPAMGPEEMSSSHRAASQTDKPPRITSPVQGLRLQSNPQQPSLDNDITNVQSTGVPKKVSLPTMRHLEQGHTCVVPGPGIGNETLPTVRLLNQDPTSLS
jgi:hypothetical protein